MNQKFSGQLDLFIREAGLPLRRVARESGIPHQTIFNWMRGTQPRWYPALPGDLQHLGLALGLNDDEVALLLRLAGCAPKQPGFFTMQEVPMENKYRMPKGWFITGDAPEKYEVGLDPETKYENQPCVTIKARPEPTEFVALAQMIKAMAYRGKRLQFSAVVRAENVMNMAALFMRISDANGKMLAFDNMRNRPVAGSSDWTHHAVVLDVAKDAEDIIFGLLLSLEGQVWVSGVRLIEVSKEVPTTDLLNDVIENFPVNLDFSE